MEATRSSSQALGLELPPALQLHILSFLPPNDRALSGRLVSPDATAGLSGPEHCTASLSQPLPPHAVPWAVEAAQQHMRQLPFRHKMRLLSTAAASGSEVNLEMTLALLQPSVFPELLQQNKRSRTDYSDPGVAAVKAGHPQLLGWLVRHCPALLIERAIVRGAAKHCDLAGLQAVWAALGSTAPSWLTMQEFLDEAAASPVDAEAKMEWVLAEGRGSCSLQESTAAAATRSGGLGRLRWLRERGCPMGDYKVLQSALQHAHLAVAKWLVEEAGCELPAATGQAARWRSLLYDAAMSPDGVSKLQWLRERGAPLILGGDSDLVLGSDRDGSEGDRDDDGKLARLLLHAAAEEGHVEVVRHLLSLSGPAARQQLLADPDLPYCAAKSGSIPMVEFLRQAGCTASYEAYAAAAQAAVHNGYLAAEDFVAMFWWLVREVGVSAARFDVLELQWNWPSNTFVDRRGLLEAVQLVVGKAECRGRLAEVAVETAARAGEPALVQYLLQRAQGYQPDWGLLLAVVEGGCEALLEWLVEQHPGCLEGAGPRESPYATAAGNGDLGTLTALRRLGVPWGAEDVVAQAVEWASGASALRWLEEQGAPGGGA